MSNTDTESQIASFLGKYTPAIEGQLRDARARLCAHFPRGFELVFDNYNALVFGISPTKRSQDAFISVAGYPKWVTLFFLYGTDLQDPHGLLEGEGKQVRSVRLKSPDDIHTHRADPPSCEGQGGSASGRAADQHNDQSSRSQAASTPAQFGHPQVHFQNQDYLEPLG